jgi:hypothetical protein
MNDPVPLVPRRHAPIPRDPRTPEEWQEAVNMAEFLLALDSCKQYGLIEGGPTVKFERALKIIERGKARGVVPAPFEEELMKMYLITEASA